MPSAFRGLRDLVGGEGAARDFDHGADLVAELLLLHFRRDAVDDGDLEIEFLLLSDERDSGEKRVFLWANQYRTLHKNPLDTQLSRRQNPQVTNSERKIPAMKPTMKTKSRFLILAFSASLPLTVPAAHADTFGSGDNTFTIGFVPIGNSGNAADGSGYGAVPYNFNMSTYAISQDQLAKAASSLGISLGGGAWVGSQPAANVTWYQAAAFVNYLNTSTGHVAAYQLNAGATALTLWSSAQAWQAGGENLYRNKDAYYFLPSENEYYKAAYYDPNKAGGAGYWLYATGSNAIPTAVASGTAAGTAVYNGVASQPAAVDQSGGLSPYLTMGQSGNVYEWHETANDGENNSSSENRAIRGGAWLYPEFDLRSSIRNVLDPAFEGSNVGFRVASVPEPSCMILMIGSGLMFLARRRRGSSL